MAKGNLYYYFSNKHELLFFCQDHSLDQLIGGAEEVLASDDSDDTKLRRIVVQHVECVLDVLDGASAHTEVHALPDDLRARVIAKRDRYEAVVRKLVQAGITAGTFVQTDAKMATLALLGALNGATRWYKPGGGRTPSSIGESFADLFLDGLRANGKQTDTRSGT
jgi:AcrR family transcriptional regulator